MNKFIVSAAIVTAMGAASLGFAGTAGASLDVTNMSAADAVQILQQQGYTVQLNGMTGNMALSRCKAIGVEGLRGTMSSTDVMMMLMEPEEFDTVYLDVTCPNSNN